MGPESAEVGAVISDLESEYERSTKFLADLYRSLEAGGAMKRPSGPAGQLDDTSPFVSKDPDGPAGLHHETAASNHFGTFDLSKDDSGLSNCTECSSCVPRLPDLNPDANRSPSGNNSPANTAGKTTTNSNHNQRRGDVMPVPTASSPIRHHTSARAGRKPAIVSSSCPSMDPSLNEGYERAATAVVMAAAGRYSSGSNLDVGPPQRRPSGLGSCEASAALSHVFTPPQPPVGNLRHRRSSLDFVPAPSAHHRKWFDSTILGPQQQQGPPPPGCAPPPAAPAGNAQGEGHKSYPLVKRGSLEVFGCHAAPASSSSGNPSCSGAAPGGGASTNAGSISGGGAGGLGVVGGSILARASCPLSRRLLIQASQHQSPQPQQQGGQHHHEQLQLLQQSQSLPLSSPLQLEPPRATAPLVRSPASRNGTEGGGQAHSTIGSPLGSGGIGLLPPLLQTAPSGDLFLALPSPGARGGGEHGGHSPCTSPAAGAMPRGSSNGAATTVAAAPHEPTSWTPGEVRPRSAGRFSRCGQAAAGAAGAATAAGAIASGTAFPASATSAAADAAAATSLLCQGVSGAERRALSSGEIPNLTTRTAVALASASVGGGGGGSRGSCNGSPLSAREEVNYCGVNHFGSPLVRRGSDYGGGGGTAAAASRAHTPMGAISAAAPAATAIAAPGAGAASLLGLQRQSSHQQQQHQQHMHQQHSLLHNLTLHHHSPSQAPAVLSPGAGPVAGARSETRTRLGLGGPQR